MRKALMDLMKENAQLEMDLALEQIERMKERASKLRGKGKIELETVIDVCLDGLKWRRIAEEEKIK